MENTQYKYVPYDVEFVHDNMRYIKTNFSRGYYYREGRKVFRKFKKPTVVQVEKKYIELAH